MLLAPGGSLGGKRERGGGVFAGPAVLAGGMIAAAYLVSTRPPSPPPVAAASPPPVTFNVPEFKLSEFKVPEFRISEFKLPKVNLPKVDPAELARREAERLAALHKLAEDAKAALAHEETPEDAERKRRAAIRAHNAHASQMMDAYMSGVMNEEVNRWEMEQQQIQDYGNSLMRPRHYILPPGSHMVR